MIFGTSPTLHWEYLLRQKPNPVKALIDSAMHMHEYPETLSSKQKSRGEACSDECATKALLYFLLKEPTSEEL